MVDVEIFRYESFGPPEGFGLSESGVRDAHRQTLQAPGERSVFFHTVSDTEGKVFLKSCNFNSGLEFKTATINLDLNKAFDNIYI